MSVFAAFNQLGELLAELGPNLNSDTLRALLAKGLPSSIKGKLVAKGINADFLVALCSPLGEVNQDFGYPLAKASSGGSALSFDAGAKALLDVVQADKAADYPHFSTSADRRLVISQLQASLAVNAEGDAGALSGGIDSSLKVDYQVVCSAPQQSDLWALVSSQGAQPFTLLDAKALAAALARPSAGARLEGLSLLRSHRLGVHFKVQAGKSYQLGSAVSAGVSLSGAIGFTGQFDGQFRLVVKGVKGQPAQLALSLYRQHKNSQQHSLSLGADIAIDGLAQWTDQLLAPLDSQATSLGAVLEEWKKPGDKLRQWLGDELTSSAGDNLQATVSAISQYLTGQSESLGPVKTLLSDKVSALMDAQLAPYQQDANTLAQSLAAKLGASLKLPANLTAQLQDSLSGGIDQLYSKLTEAINQWASSKGGAAIDEAQQQLARSKDALAALASGINTTTVPLVQGVYHWLNDYQALRKKVSDALGQSARMKVGIAFLAEAGEDQEQEAMLAFTLLDAGSPAGSALYRKLLAGQGLDLDELAAANQQGLISTPQGWLMARHQHSRKLGVTCQLFGFELSQQRAFNDISTVKVAANGDLLLATSEIAQTDSSSFWGESRSAGFLCTYDLARALSDGTLPQLGLSFNFVDDKGMSQKEFKQLLAPLTTTQPPLLAASAYQSAYQWYSQVVLPNGSKRSAVQCTTQLSPQQLHTLLSASAQQWLATGAKVVLERINQKPDLAKLMKMTVGDSKGDALTVLRTFDAQVDGVVSQFNESTNQGREANKARRIRSAIKHLDQLAALPGYLTQLKTAVATLKGQPEALLAALNALNRDIQQAVKGWLECQNVLMGLLVTESLTDAMLDLQLILARLIGSEQPLLVPVITLGSGVDAEVRVLA